MRCGLKCSIHLMYMFQAASHVSMLLMVVLVCFLLSDKDCSPSMLGMISNCMFPMLEWRVCEGSKEEKSINSPSFINLMVF